MSAPTYEEARARIAADLVPHERDYPGRSFMLIYRDDLKAVLAGPPEPSVGEVAMAWLDRSMPLPPPDSRLNVAMRALAISAAERVQALYRSKAAPQPDE